MRIRFIKKYGYILEGSTPLVEDKEARRLIDAGYAIEITESVSDIENKELDMPNKDKMMRKRKTKSKGVL